jgi:saccharopine dehydrogenase-like NADP-dependent oxidoreductase
LDVIDMALQTGTHYVDMNDDHEVAEALFNGPAWDDRAKQAGLTVLSGCGIMPGLSGILARYGYDQLDKADGVSIWFAWNYSLSYPAAIHHFLRINSGLGPQYINGVYSRPGPFTGRVCIDFLPPVGAREVYYTGVPDPISVVHSLPSLTNATARGAFYQPAANELMEAMVRWGFTSYENVPGAAQSPMAFLMSYISSQGGKARFDIPPERVPMAVRVEVWGVKEGAPLNLTYEAHDYSRRATTVVAALCTLMVATRRLSACGVGTLEGWVPVQPFLRQLTEQSDIKMFAVEDGKQPSPLQP